MINPLYKQEDVVSFHGEKYIVLNKRSNQIALLSVKSFGKYKKDELAVKMRELRERFALECRDDFVDIVLPVEYCRSLFAVEQHDNHFYERLGIILKQDFDPFWAELEEEVSDNWKIQGHQMGKAERNEKLETHIVLVLNGDTDLSDIDYYNYCIPDFNYDRTSNIMRKYASLVSDRQRMRNDYYMANLPESIAQILVEGNGEKRYGKPFMNDINAEAEKYLTIYNKNYCMNAALIEKFEQYFDRTEIQKKTFFKFPDEDEKVAMHCPDMHAAEVFVAKILQAGKVWGIKDEHGDIDHVQWRYYGVDNAYCFNENKVLLLADAEKKGYKILEFTDYVWNEY